MRTPVDLSFLVALCARQVWRHLGAVPHFVHVSRRSGFATGHGRVCPPGRGVVRGPQLIPTPLGNPIVPMLRSAIALLTLLAVVVPRANGQALEVDHMFIMVPARAPVMEALAAAGFRVRPDSGVHEGIGTASFGIAFANAYLELVWIVDSADFARSPFGLAQRLAATPRGSPFGIGLRQASGHLDALPFETSSYQAEWMLPGAASEIAAWTGDVREPAVLVVAPPMTWLATLEEFPAILERLPHPNGIRELTRVLVAGPGLPVESAVSRALVRKGLVEFVRGPDHHLELFFDHGAGRNWDFRPTLPLVIWYR